MKTSCRLLFSFLLKSIFSLRDKDCSVILWHPFRTQLSPLPLITVHPLSKCNFDMHDFQMERNKDDNWRQCCIALGTNIIGLLKILGPPYVIIHVACLSSFDYLSSITLKGFMGWDVSIGCSNNNDNQSLNAIHFEFVKYLRKCTFLLMAVKKLRKRERETHLPGVDFQGDNKKYQCYSSVYLFHRWDMHLH